jgi:capsular exopolysaccharide synthesis family protein
MSLPAIPEESGPPPELEIKEYLKGSLSVFRRRWVVCILVLGLVLALGILVTVKTKPVYETSATVVLDTSVGSTGTTDPSNSVADVLASVPSGFNAQLALLQSPSLFEDAKRAAGIRARRQVVTPTETVESLGADTSSVKITVDGGDPEEIAKLANVMIDLHLAKMDQLRKAARYKAIQFAREEKARADQVVARSEQRVLQFRRAHPSLSALGPGSFHATEYATLKAKALEAKAESAAAQAGIVKLQSRLRKEPETLDATTTRENPRVSKLRDRLDELSIQKMEKLRDFRPSSREVRDIEQQIHLIQRQIAAEPRQIRLRQPIPNPARSRLQARLDTLETNLQAYQQTYQAAEAQLLSMQLPTDDQGAGATELGHLNRDLATALSAYTIAADRLRDVESHSRALQHITRADPAVARAPIPDTPIKPHRAKLLAMTVVAALLLAASSALLLEFLDDRLTVPTAHRLLRLPVLGQIPLIPGDGHPLLSLLPSLSRAAASYRSLRANITFAAMDAPLRTLVVTSSGHGEGKTSVALNLAISLALAGRTVILVDADLHRSSLHRLLDLTPGPGLTDALTENQPAEQLLQRTQIAGLLVLTSGLSSTNPADLLSMGTMAHLIEELRQVADFVVFDAPPCVLLPDAQLLAAQTDGVLLVSDVTQARKATVRTTKQLLERAYARVVGVVFNKTTDHEGPLRPMIGSGEHRAPRAVESDAPQAALPPSGAQTHASRPIRGHSLTYVGLFLFTTVLYYRPYELFPALSWASSSALVIALFTLAVYIPSQISLEGNLSASLPEVRLVLCLVLAALLSFTLALDRSLAWETFSDQFIKAVIMFIVMVNVVRTEQRLKGMLFLALSVSVTLSLGSINDFRQGHYAYTHGFHRIAGIIGGMFVNPNEMAHQYVISTPIAVALFFSSRSRILKALCIITAALLVAGIVVSYSREGLLGLTAAGGILLWKLGRRNPAAAAAVALLCILAFSILAPGDYGHRVASIFNPALDDGSSDARRTLLTRSIQVSLRNPAFGIGIGNFPVIGIHDQVTHNAYTQVAAEVGFPALVIYVAFLVLPLRRLRVVERYARTRLRGMSLFYLAIGLQASLVGFMVSSFFDSVAYQWYLYFLVAYAVCLGRIYQAEAAADGSAIIQPQRRYPTSVPRRYSHRPLAG